jgi:hypothetical protein
MAERLKRLTRNQMGSPRVGSNPTGRDSFFSNFFHRVNARGVPM